MDDDTKPARRGRPPKTLTGEAYLRLLDELGNGFKAGTFAQACERAGTSVHVVKKAMRDSLSADFAIRVACMVHGRKRLSDGDSDPDMLFEAGKEAEMIEAGDRPRPWSEVEALIRRRRDWRKVRAEIQSPSRVVIPEARTPEEENF